jgi:hypothetical protein
MSILHTYSDDSSLSDVMNTVVNSDQSIKSYDPIELMDHIIAEEEVGTLILTASTLDSELCSWLRSMIDETNHIKPFTDEKGVERQLTLGDVMRMSNNMQGARRQRSWGTQTTARWVDPQFAQFANLQNSTLNQQYQAQMINSIYGSQPIVNINPSETPIQSINQSATEQTIIETKEII